MENKTERRIYIPLLLILCLISFGLGYYLFRLTNTKEIRQVPVSDTISLNATPILPHDVTVINSYVGFVEAINQVQVIPYISGYLEEIPVKAGQFVKKDDLLIKIEPQEYRARLEAAQASVLQAQAAFEYNQNYYERVQKSGKRAFSEIEIDNAKNNFLQAQASLKNAEANQALADVNFKYTVIKAPISGLVGNFNLSPGDYVAPNSGALLSIVQTNPIRVVFSLTDTEYLNMKENGKLFKDSVIKLKMANGAEFKYSGEFKYTDNQVDRGTNSLSVYTYFKNDDNELMPNAYVTVEVHKTFKDSVLLNKNYIKMLPDGNYLTIARNDKILNEPIEILSDRNNQYVLKNTFQQGDLLILDDTAKLTGKEKITFNIEK